LKGFQRYCAAGTGQIREKLSHIVEDGLGGA
jgi:hypothetical protein